jgi:hypothetical protein
MTDLIGSATVRVSSNTDAAHRAIRQFATRAETQLRGVQRLSPITITTRFNDQTRRDLTTVRTAVTDLQRLGPVRIPVQINDGTRRGARSVQATVATLQRLGPIRIGADIDVDPTTTAAAASALRAVQDAARGAARALGTLATRATTATAALTALAAAARSLRSDMDDLDGSIRRVGAGMTGLRGRLGTISTSASSAGSALDGLKTAALLLSPALIPIAVQAAPIAAGLAAATVAVGAFGLAIGGQIASLSEASDAEKKYKDAVEEHGVASAQAAKAQQAYQRTVAELPKPTRAAATALSVMKTEYRQWSDSLAGNTMPVATKSFAAFGALFPKLTPLVRGASGQLNRFVTIAAGGIQSPGFDRFMQNLAEFSTGVMAKANGALLTFTRNLQQGTYSGSGVSTFMEYVRANGPLVRDTLSNLSRALGNILEAAANVGPGLLTVVNALAQLVAAVPPGAITAMLQLSLALKAVSLAAAATAAGTARVTAIGTAITAMRTAAAGATGVVARFTAALGALSRGAKLALAGTGIGLVAIAIGKLAAMGKEAPPDVDRLTSSLGKLAATGKVSGEAAKAFGKDLEDLYGKVRNITDPSFVDQAQNAIVKIFTLGQVDSTASTNAQDALDAIDDSLVNLVQGGKIREAAIALEVFADAYAKGGKDASKFRAEMDEYNDALESHKVEMEIAARAQGLFGEQAQKTSSKLAEQKASADGLRQAIQALNDVQRAGLGGMIGFEAAIDNAAKAAKENGEVLSMQNGQLTLNTEKQRAAAQALTDLAARTDEAAAANRESTGSWAGAAKIYERGRAELIKNAQAMGLNKDEAEALARQILKTPDKKAMLTADISDWKTKISDAEGQLKKAKGSKKAKLTADIADWKVKVAEAEKALVGAKASKKAKLTADIDVWKAKVGQAEEQLKTAKGSKKAKLTADISDWKKKISSAQTQINNLPSSKSTTLYMTKINTTIYDTKGSLHDVVGATGGLYTGKTFKHRGYQRGGLVDGPGTETSDSVFAPWLSKNEFVVNAKQTAKHLPLLKAINSGGLGMAKGGMAGAGADVGAGLASGLSGATGAVLAAARAMAGAVSDGVRRELQIASPSKVMKVLAKDVGKGFISGLTGSRDKIKAVSKDLAKDVKAAFSGKKESALLKMIESDTKKLLSAAKKRDAVEKKIAEAKKFATDTANEARATGSLATIVQPDHFSPKYVKGQMQASLKQIKDFTANVKKLQKKGLNKDLLKQILEMGPEEGAAFAKSLAGADKATIKQYNSLNKQISAESSKLGKYGADLLYDSGKKAGDGFLTGLKAQQKDIEKLMLDIAKGMQKAIKKALGIKSPSRVFAMIGRNVGDGFVSGIAATHAKVATAAQKMGDTASTTARRHLTSVPSAVARGASTPQIPSGTLTALARQNNRSRSADVHHHYHVTLENRGVIGSPMQVQDWLARGLDQLARTGRIPSSMRGAA